MSRLSTPQLLALGEQLGPSEREIVEVVAKLRLASHAQLAALLNGSPSASSEASRARAIRRTLARLSEQRLLCRLTRRVGGVRAGSAGYVYYLGPAGQRLLAYWQGRGLVRGRLRPEPGSRYVRHRLAISELYVQATGADRDGNLDLLAFDIEPDCWRPFSADIGGERLLKPDAYLRVGVGAYEDRAFVEVDLGSESRPVLASKARAYVDYFNAGVEQAEHGVFPRVLLLTNSQARKAAIVDVCAKLPAEHWQLFTVTTLDKGIEAISGQIEADIHHGEDREAAL